MATFDQLPADQRAIIELVLKRGRTYDALSEMLGMPTTRVRELARDALTELAPFTAERVDPDWRDQVADYILGQQSGPESVATQGHLRRNEGARAWFLSLMDSLDHLYANGTRPELPEADADRPRARDRKGRDRERPATREERPRDRAAVKDKAKDEDEDAKDDADADDEESSVPKGVLSSGRRGGPLSPAARKAVKRRRIIGAVAGLAAIALLVLILTGTLFGGDDDNGGGGGEEQAGTTTGQQQNAQTQLIGQVELQPTRLAGNDSAGFAAIAQTGNRNQVAIRAKLPPTDEDEAYEVWLYNGKGDAVSVGAQRTDAQGNYEGAGEIPEGTDYRKYKFIDVTLEKVDQNAEHSGRSVLRGEVANLQAPPAGQQGGAGQGGQAPPGGQPAPPGGGQTPAP